MSPQSVPDIVVEMRTTIINPRERRSGFVGGALDFLCSRHGAFSMGMLWAFLLRALPWPWWVEAPLFLGASFGLGLWFNRLTNEGRRA